MNDKDNLTKAYNAVIEMGVSPTDLYIYNQIINSDEAFGLDDHEIVKKVEEVKESFDRDYSCKLTLDQHIEKVLLDGYYDITDDEEEEYY